MDPTGLARQVGYCFAGGNQMALWELSHWLSRFGVASLEGTDGKLYRDTTGQWLFPINYKPIEWFKIQYTITQKRDNKEFY